MAFKENAISFSWKEVTVQINVFLVPFWEEGSLFTPFPKGADLIITAQMEILQPPLISRTNWLEKNSSIFPMKELFQIRKVSGSKWVITTREKVICTEILRFACFSLFQQHLRGNPQIPRLHQQPLLKALLLGPRHLRPSKNGTFQQYRGTLGSRITPWSSIKAGTSIFLECLGLQEKLWDEGQEKTASRGGLGIGETSVSCRRKCRFRPFAGLDPWKSSFSPFLLRT